MEKHNPDAQLTGDLTVAEGDELRDPLEVLADQFTRRCRAGESPSIEEQVQRYPQWEQEIRDLFPMIAAMERLKRQKERSSSGHASLGAVRLESLGDYRIVREIGRGGMGIVYEAVQESLHRRVAVKVLPQQLLLDPKHLMRFEREARTAARLHHTNIVPVFGTGEDDGFHYIVMQYIRGISLDNFSAPSRTNPKPSDETETGSLNVVTPGLEKSSSNHQPTQESGHGELTALFRDCRKVCALGLQAAEALAYAHAQGVLHRDIKPANLLLDTDGNLWITDFGVAKIVGTIQETRTGDTVGTLRYMAPEQLAGKPDVRSDIYSLGLTLYELLCLRPAFDATVHSQLMHQVLHEAPPRLRSLRPDVPRDLETIVLKTIARKPEDRYQTVSELVGDLQKFLSDRPISARRPSAAELLWRWCRRNPAVATLASLSLSLLVTVAVVASYGYAKTRAANKRVENAYQAELSAREKADETANLALEVLDRIFENYAPTRTMQVHEMNVAIDDDQEVTIPNQPALSDETATLLENMLEFYDRLALRGGNETPLRQKVARANRRVGQIHQSLGNWEDAKAAYQQAALVYEELTAESSEQSSFVIDLAGIHNEIGAIFEAAGDHEQARLSYRRAMELLAPTLENRDDSESAFELARTYYLLGRRSRPEVPVGPPHPPERHRHPNGEHSPNVSPPRRRSDPDSEEWIQQAIAQLQTLREKNPANPEYKHLLALCYRQLPPARGESRDRRSMDFDQRATQLLEELVKDYPSVAEYRYDLSETYAGADMGRPFRNREEHEFQEDRLRRALSLSQDLVREHPNVPEYSAAQVHILYRLAHLLHDPRRGPGPPGHRHRQNGRGNDDPLDEAERLLRQALKLQMAQVERFPDLPSNRGWLAILQRDLAIVLRDRGDIVAAREMIESSVDGFTALLESDSQNEVFHGPLARAYQDLAEILSETGEETEAIQAEQKAEQHRAQLPRSMRPGPHGHPRDPHRRRRPRGRLRHRDRP